MGGHFQKPWRYIDAVAVNTQGKRIPMGQSGINGMAFHNLWAGTLGGTLTFEASNDPALETAVTQADEDAADWVDISAQLTFTNPVTGDDNDMVVVNNSRFWWFRIRLSAVTGTGTFSCYPASHGEG